MDGVRKNILFQFASDKLPAFKNFCEVQRTRYRKVKNSTFNNSSNFIKMRIKLELGSMVKL